MNDGSLLFLQHMIDKFEPVRPAEQKHGSRLAIVFSGSPLFTGGAGSGESDIRKWIIENDWLEAIIALPEQMFYNTGIGTYVWIVTNRKEKRRKGKIQLLDARDVWTAGGSEDNKRSLGDKRRHITGSQIAEIVKLYGRQADGETSKTFDNADFGYTRVTVERPLRLRYQMTLEDKARFLDACPHLLDDVQAIDKALGPRAAARLECGVEPHRGPAARAQVPLEGDRAEALPQRLHAEGPRGRAGRQGRARRRVSSRTPTCAISRTCRSRTTSTPTSSARCARTCPTPGWTAARTRSATRSTSTATSTSTRRRVRWRRSTRS